MKNDLWPGMRHNPMHRFRIPHIGNMVVNFLFQVEQLK
jgi:hypothetical protein